MRGHVYTHGSDATIFAIIIVAVVAVIVYAHQMGWMRMAADSFRRIGSARARRLWALLICGAVVVLAVSVYMFFRLW